MSDALRPETPQQLTQFLADTIGNDVMSRMDAVGWDFTQNPPPAVVPAVNPQTPTSTEPQPVATTPANPGQVSPEGATPQSINWNDYRDANGLILGKYKSEGEAIRGYHSLLHLAKDALHQRDQATLAVTSLQQQQMNQPRPVSYGEPDVGSTGSPSNKTGVLFDAVLSKIQESGGQLEPEDLKSLFAAHEQSLVEKIRQENQENEARRQATEQKWLEVDRYMSATHPDSVPFADQMGVWANTQPEVARVKDALVRNGNYLEASVYVWEQFAKTLPVVDPAQVAEEERIRAAGMVRQEAVEAARRDAGLLGSTAGGVHPTPPSQQGPTQQQIDEAAAYMNRTGRGEAWRDMVIGRSLTGPLFDPN